MARRIKYDMTKVSDFSAPSLVIAAEIGCTAPLVNYWRKKLGKGPPRRSPLLSDTLLDDVPDAVWRALPNLAIGTKFNLTKQCVGYARARLKKPQREPQTADGLARAHAELDRFVISKKKR